MLSFPVPWSLLLYRCLGGNVECCQKHSTSTPTKLQRMHIPDSDHNRKPLPDGDALWTGQVASFQASFLSKRYIWHWELFYQQCRGLTNGGFVSEAHGLPLRSMLLTITLLLSMLVACRLTAQESWQMHYEVRKKGTTLASYPGSRWVGKREPGIHCLCIRLISQKSWEIGNCCYIRITMTT